MGSPIDLIETFVLHVRSTVTPVDATLGVIAAFIAAALIARRFLVFVVLSWTAAVVLVAVWLTPPISTPFAIAALLSVITALMFTVTR